MLHMLRAKNGSLEFVGTAGEDAVIVRVGGFSYEFDLRDCSLNSVVLGVLRADMVEFLLDHFNKVVP